MMDLFDWWACLYHYSVCQLKHFFLFFCLSLVMVIRHPTTTTTTIPTNTYDVVATKKQS